MDSAIEMSEAAQDWFEGLSADTVAELDSPPISLLVTGAAIAAGVATRHGLKSCWKQLRGVDPPENPTAADVTWADALMWAAAVGAAVGVARVLGRLGASAAAEKIAARR